MTISLTPVPANMQVSKYSQMIPLMTWLKRSNDQLPKSESPVQSFGTIQQNVEKLPKVSIYTDHGKLATDPQGNLLGYA